MLSVASAQPPTPNLTGISANWRIISADQVQGEEAAVSPPSFDASGSTAHVHGVNQRSEPLSDVTVSVRFYNLDGTQQHFAEARHVNLSANASLDALSVPRIPAAGDVHFVRCQMTETTGKILADSVYWESKSGDAIGPASSDKQFQVNWSQLADFAALNKMAPAHAVVSGTYEEENGENLGGHQHQQQLESRRFLFGRRDLDRS